MRSKLAAGGLTVAVAFLLVTNPVVVDAAGQVTGAQIKNNSIKGKDVKDNSLSTKDVKNETLKSEDIANGQIGSADVADSAIGTVDLATEARGAKVLRYPVPGSHNFASNSLLCAQIPGLSAEDVRSSQWSAGMEATNIYFTIGNWGLGPASEYRVSADTSGAIGRACIFKASGPGETYSNISFYRTVPSTTTAPVTVIPKAASRG